MTSTPGDGQPPSDPYRQGPAEPGASSSGEPAGRPPEPPPGYWQQQSQSPGTEPPGSYGDQQPTYGEPQYGQPTDGQPQYGQQPPYGQPYPTYPVTPPNHGGALASMIVGIVSLVLACGYGVGLLASPVAWYLGSRSLREIDASQGRLGGRGMAQAGKIMGIIGTVLLGLLVVVVVVGVLLLVANSDTSSF
jgi:hypothetical protein